MKTTIEKAKTPGVYVLRNVTLAYPSVQSVSTFCKGGYGTEILIPKESSEVATSLKKVATDTARDFFGSRATFKVYIADGDNQLTKDGDPNPSPKAYKMGHFVLRALNKNKPQLNDLTGDNDFYHGCLADVWIAISCYTSKTYAGSFVSFNLVAVQKKAGGEQLPTGVVYDVSDEFEEFSDNASFDDVPGSPPLSAGSATPDLV